MSFKKGDRVLVVGNSGHLNGRVATVLGTDGFDRVRIEVTVKLPEVGPDWSHDYWAVDEDQLVPADAVTELGEIVR